MFRDEMHGWGRLLLAINISPAAADFDENARVLRDGCKAMRIAHSVRVLAPAHITR